MLSAGQVAGLIVALFWAVLVSFLALALHRLARLLTEATRMVAEIGDRTGPLLNDLTSTVEQAHEQLDRVDAITKGMAGVTQNVSAVSTVVSSVVSGPLVKGAAFAYGVRKVLGQDREDQRRRRVRVDSRPRPGIVRARSIGGRGTRD